jgi:hypothetical protein
MAGTVLLQQGSSEEVAFISLGLGGAKGKYYMPAWLSSLAFFYYCRDQTVTSKVSRIQTEEEEFLRA